MRFDGRLIQWNDERGFGFIEPAQGGDKVFVHIRAFARADREPSARPRVGERLSFEIELDTRGRKQARRVGRADALVQGSARPAAARANPRRRHESPPRRGSLAGLASTLLGLALMAAIAWQGASWWNARHAERALPQAAATAPVVEAAAATAFRCDGRTYCSQMTSCAEATYFLRHCPGVKMDGNGDGVPCEQQWCTSPWAK